MAQTHQTWACQLSWRSVSAVATLVWPPPWTACGVLGLRVDQPLPRLPPPPQQAARLRIVCASCEGTWRGQRRVRQLWDRLRGPRMGAGHSNSTGDPGNPRLGCRCLQSTAPQQGVPPPLQAYRILPRSTPSWPGITRGVQAQCVTECECLLRDHFEQSEKCTAKHTSSADCFFLRAIWSFFRESTLRPRKPTTRATRMKTRA